MFTNSKTVQNSVKLVNVTETIKRQTRAARVVVWLEGCKPVCAGLAYKPIGCTSALSVTYSAAAAAACGAI